MEDGDSEIIRVVYCNVIRFLSGVGRDLSPPGTSLTITDSVHLNWVFGLSVVRSEEVELFRIIRFVIHFIIRSRENTLRYS